MGVHTGVKSGGKIVRVNVCGVIGGCELWCDWWV